MNTYEEIMSKFTIQLSIAKQQNDIIEHKRILGEMVQLSTQHLTLPNKYRKKCQKYNRSKTYEKE